MSIANKPSVFFPAIMPDGGEDIMARPEMNRGRQYVSKADLVRFYTENGAKDPEECAGRVMEIERETRPATSTLIPAEWDGSVQSFASALLTFAMGEERTVWIGGVRLLHAKIVHSDARGFRLRERVSVEVANILTMRPNIKDAIPVEASGMRRLALYRELSCDPVDPFVASVKMVDVTIAMEWLIPVRASSATLKEIAAVNGALNEGARKVDAVVERLREPRENAAPRFRAVRDGDCIPTSDPVKLLEWFCPNIGHERAERIARIGSRQCIEIRAASLHALILANWEEATAPSTLAAGQVWEVGGEAEELVRQANDREWFTAGKWEGIILSEERIRGGRYLGTREQVAARERAAKPLVTVASGETYIEGREKGATAANSGQRPRAASTPECGKEPGASSAPPLGTDPLPGPRILPSSAPKVPDHDQAPAPGESDVAFTARRQRVEVRREVDRLIAADGGPFARARAAALRTACECNPPSDPTFAATFMALLCAYEAERGGRRTPSRTVTDLPRSSDRVEGALAVYERERAR